MFEKTICVRLVGGLGNQMFIAAAGLALAKRTRSTLAFDLSAFDQDPKRDYALACFNLNALLLPSGLDAELVGKPVKNRGILQKLLGPFEAKIEPRFRHWQQPNDQFDPTFDSLEGNVYISGYFQSPLFFADAEETVRSAFQLHPLLSERGRYFSDAAREAGECSVAIHVRRGDYVSDPVAASIHGSVDDRYYRRALDLLEPHVPNAQIFIVSDEPEAAAAMFPEFKAAIVTTETGPYDDMNLIGQCRHKVIANSSFSWWGAWLGGQGNGKVIAPRQWFTRERMRSTSLNDLLPDDWIMV